ncbi:hypothetical protein TOPH_00102 [Tolypocladium ophioglossoides CBS 100239]|uniref:Pre-mRNA splicing factor CLF1 n=1 Tax=Tolypocladium ophioglossoides (strain CBS 100239) TaxID=1163406 RepID=A0A0L0NNA0_TOLOC|nr:hypothetical protein TOPH_00102 [Tolypocladium ophioglossoides CBS 100239]
MSVPKPPASLDNSCSVIHDNTLYSFSPEDFLSIPLEDSAKWTKLQMGVKVTGATCVGSTPPDASQAGFYVVGGKADSDDFTGLQKYTYSTGQWSTIKLTDQVTKNRQWHASTYIQADDAILVYAGSQDGTRGLSTQTFTIQASEPHTVRGYESVAPPAISPILMSWSGADAAMIGGGTGRQHAKVWLFNPTAHWRDSGASLAVPLQKDTTSIQAVLVNGDDGSKSLYTFDLSQSPNKVSRIVLQDATGTPISNSRAVTRRGLDSAVPETKRALTLSNWPEYNSTLEPTVTRQNFATAQGPDGIVVFSGGNSDSPLAIFNANKNGWVNATALLGDQEQTMLFVSSTTTSATSTSTSISSTSTSASSTMQTTAASTTAAAAIPPVSVDQSNNSGPSSDAILGITLGSIAGFLALLGLILLLLRQRQKRQNHVEAGQTRRASGASSDEKDTTAFANSTLPVKSAGHFRGHYPQGSQESYASMAILMGRMGKERSGLSRKPSNDTTRSSVSSLHKQFKSTISKPIPQMADHPALAGQDDRGVAFAPTVAEPRPRHGPMEAQDGTRRSSGWNRYWSGGSALQILGFGAAKTNTAGSERSSHYSEATNNNNPSRVTQDSATVPPLNFEGLRFEGRPEVNSVNSGSPVVSQYNIKVPTEGMSGKIERPVSAVSTLSSGYSSGIPESINEAWGATETGKPWGADRAPSSAYSPSHNYGTPLAPSSAGARMPPSGVSKQPQLAMAATSSDMSWLNLGDQSRK